MVTWYMNTNLPFGPGAAGHLSDDQFVAAFESVTLAEDRFRHADHVRLGWIYLGRMSLVDTIARYGEGLRRFAAAHGAPDRYHETVTWALLVIIHQRMRRGGEVRSWTEFAAANADLLRWRDGPLFEHYDSGILDSREARDFFVLPPRFDPRRGRESG